MKFLSRCLSQSLHPAESVLLVLIAGLLCTGMSCRPTGDQTKAGATTPARTGDKVASAISVSESNTVAALVALDKKYIALQAEYDALKQQSAVAAAQVSSANLANTNQPASPATRVVDLETKLALTNLPPQDVKEALEAAKRRAAVLEGRTAEAELLYKTAQTEAERMKAEQIQLKADTAKAQADAELQRQKAAAAQLALVEAEKRQALELKANEAANQAKLDAANKKADEAVQKAYEERQNLLVRILIGIGSGCILAGIGLAIATSGASAVRSAIAVFCGLVCFGLCRVLSHPWFNTIFVVCALLVTVGAVAYLWHERKQALDLKNTTTAKLAGEEALQLANKTLTHVVRAVEDVRAKSPELNATLEERLDYHTSPDSTRPAYIKLKSEVNP